MDCMELTFLFNFFFSLILKGRCNREKPPCKYFHPPQHLKDQLLINGRNNLAFKNALLQQVGITTTTGPPVVRSQVPAVVRSFLLPFFFSRSCICVFVSSPPHPPPPVRSVLFYLWTWVP